MSNETVRRSTFTKESVHGRIKKMPGYKQRGEWQMICGCFAQLVKVKRSNCFSCVYLALWPSCPWCGPAWRWRCARTPARSARTGPQNTLTSHWYGNWNWARGWWLASVLLFDAEIVEITYLDAEPNRDGKENNDEDGGQYDQDPANAPQGPRPLGWMDGKIER